MATAHDLKTALEADVAERSLNSLTAAYVISQTGSPPVTRKKLEHELVKAFPLKVVLAHSAYMAGLSIKEKAALNFYQGAGFIAINTYLRTGQMTVEETSPSFSFQPTSPSTFKRALSHVYTKKARSHIKTVVNREFNAYKKLKRSISSLLHCIKNAPTIPATFYVYRGEKNYRSLFALDDDEVQASKQKYQMSQLNLKEGDEYTSAGFNSFSLAPWVAYNFMENACCIYRLQMTPQMPYVVFEYHDGYKEYELLLAPSKFKVVKIWYAVSPLSSSIKLRVYDLEYVGPTVASVKTR